MFRLIVPCAPVPDLGDGLTLSFVFHMSLVPLSRRSIVTKAYEHEHFHVEHFSSETLFHPSIGLAWHARCLLGRPFASSLTDFELCVCLDSPPRRHQQLRPHLPPPLYSLRRQRSRKSSSLDKRFRAVPMVLTALTPLLATARRQVCPPPRCLPLRRRRSSPPSRASSLRRRRLPLVKAR